MSCPLSSSLVSILSSPMSSVRLCWSCYWDNGNNGNNGCQERGGHWVAHCSCHTQITSRDGASYLLLPPLTARGGYWQAGEDILLRVMRRSPRWSWSLLIFGGNEIMITSSGFPGCHLATDLTVNCCTAAKMWQRMPGQQTSLKDKLGEDLLN